MKMQAVAAGPTKTRRKSLTLRFQVLHFTCVLFALRRAVDVPSNLPSSKEFD